MVYLNFPVAFSKPKFNPLKNVLGKLDVNRSLKNIDWTHKQCKIPLKCSFHLPQILLQTNVYYLYLKAWKEENNYQGIIHMRKRCPISNVYKYMSSVDL